MSGNNLLSHTILNSPWLGILIASKEYLIKYCFHSESYCIMISDLINTYYEDMTANSIVEKCENLNPKIEIQLPDVLKELENSVKKWVANSCCEGEELVLLNQCASSLQLKCTSLLTNIVFVWEFNMLAVNPLTSFSHVVQPLFGMTIEMKRRNEELVKIIEKKDAEIEDYKNNGAKATFKYLETETFSKNKFLDDMSKQEDIKCSLKMGISEIFNDPLYKNFLSAAHGSSEQENKTSIIESTITSTIENSSKVEYALTKGAHYSLDVGNTHSQSSQHTASQSCQEKRHILEPERKPKRIKKILRI